MSLEQVSKVPKGHEYKVLVASTPIHAGIVEATPQEIAGSIQIVGTTALQGLMEDARELYGEGWEVVSHCFTVVATNLVTSICIRRQTHSAANVVHNDFSTLSTVA